MSVLAPGGSANPIGANRLFEYCVALIPLPEPPFTPVTVPIPLLNELGYYGWELVGILPTGSSRQPVGFFRRDLIVTPPGQAVLALTALEPTSAVLGSPSFTLRILGAGFTPASVLVWNGTDDVCAFVSETELTTTVNMTTAEIAMPISVEVRNDVEWSNALTFEFLPAP